MIDVKFSELCQWTERQRQAVQAADEHEYMLFGGARGPGKSFMLRWYVLRGLLRYSAQFGLFGVRAMLGCETFPALRDRQIEKIQREFPEWLGYFHGSDHEYRIRPEFGGGVICLRNLDDPSKYQSAEFAIIAIDELTKNPERTFHILRGSKRWPGIERTQFVAATNPNGPGMEWVRRFWVERQFPEFLAPMAPEFVFVPAFALDNPHLPQSYRDELDALPDTIRKAWRDGDWYAGVEGVVYPEFTAENLTDDEPDPTLSIEVAFDDGYIDPRAILFIQRTATRILVFDEMYHRQHLAEHCVREMLERCAERKWPTPELAIGSPEAKELQARFRMANVPVRTQSHEVVQGVSLVRRLVCDGNGYRTMQVNRRCQNLIAEFTAGYQYPEGKRAGDSEKPMDGNDHAADAFRYWAYVRARR